MTRFCRFCGRQMIQVQEQGLYNRKTGKREMITWTQCPKFPMNILQWLVRGVHECINLDTGAVREWR